MLEIKINGRDYRFEPDAPRTLLQLLREEAGLTGTKHGCGNGECGACTVLLDGVATRSCLVLAQEAHGCEVETIEGIASPEGALDPVQQAFIHTSAVQCGFCTPGMIMAVHGLLRQHPHPTSEQIAASTSGHLCRCTGYEDVFEAVALAVGEPASEAPDERP